MIDLTGKNARRYHVGILSVLRRWSAGICLIVGCAVSSGVAASERASVGVFIRGLEDCVRFYDSYDFAVFDEWQVVSEFRRSCSDCSTTFGQVKDPDSEFMLEVNFTDRGEYIGVDCQAASAGPVWTPELAAALNRWSEHAVKSAQAEFIPSEERRFPRELIKFCERPEQPAAVNIHAGKGGTLFELMSGKPHRNEPKNCPM